MCIHSVYDYCMLVVLMYYLFFYRLCFVGNHEQQSLTSFVKAAERSHGILNYAKASDKLWSLYVLQLTQHYLKSNNIRRLTLVTCIGKQPACSTWVMGPDVQINSDGKLILPENQAFFW